MGSNFCYTRIIITSNNGSTFPQGRSWQAATKFVVEKTCFHKCVFRNISLKLVSKSLRNNFQGVYLFSCKLNRTRLPDCFHFSDLCQNPFFFRKDTSFVLLDITKLFFKDFHYKYLHSFHWILITILMVIISRLPEGYLEPFQTS